MDQRRGVDRILEESIGRRGYHLVLGHLRVAGRYGGDEGALLRRRRRIMRSKRQGSHVADEEKGSHRPLFRASASWFSRRHHLTPGDVINEAFCRNKPLYRLVVTRSFAKITGFDRYDDRHNPTLANSLHNNGKSVIILVFQLMMLHAQKWKHD